MLMCVVVSVPCSLMVICLERAGLLAVACVVFCHFPTQAPRPWNGQDNTLTGGL